MTVRDFSVAAKYRECKREVAMRRKVYPGLIARGKLTERMAAEQIAIMEAIAADYHRLLGREQLF